MSLSLHMHVLRHPDLLGITTAVMPRVSLGLDDNIYSFYRHLRDATDRGLEPPTVTPKPVPRGFKLWVPKGDSEESDEFGEDAFGQLTYMYVDEVLAIPRMGLGDFPFTRAAFVFLGELPPYLPVILEWI
jgi:hypothetical protein